MQIRYEAADRWNLTCGTKELIYETENRLANPGDRLVRSAREGRGGRLGLAEAD